MTMKRMLLLACLCFPHLLRAQIPVAQGPDSSFLFSNTGSLNSNSMNVVNVMRERGTAEEIAKSYFDMGNELSESGDFPKAKLYLEKAIEWEKKSAKKKNLSAYYRSLARVQESQSEIGPATESYSTAARFAGDSLQAQLNRNDASRLLNKSSPDQELNYLYQNGELLKRTTDVKEKTINQFQLAFANQRLHRSELAMAHYEEALATVDSTSEKAVEIRSHMVSLMATDHKLQEALQLQKEVVEASQAYASLPVQVMQLRNLAALYFELDSSSRGIETLQEAYQLAWKAGSVKEARMSLLTLKERYEQMGRGTEAAALAAEFVKGLEGLIARDSSLIDKQLFLLNEEKIADLEQEQQQKDEVIGRQNRFNYVLLGFLALLSLLLLVIVKAWLSIRRRNKQIALQSLRREMNPHFVFNSLNSVNQFIASHNERDANKYLTAYSRLMRQMMENSNKDFVSLAGELIFLKEYLELEHLRFSDKFDYQIIVDPALDAEAVMVPNMIIQPHLENAIWHGLRYKSSPGLLSLQVQQTEKGMRVLIDDNGIGRAESERMKTKNQRMHSSLGMKNVQERIQLLNEIYRSGILFEVQDKSGAETGVRVLIEW